jgi:hypothetical protein
MSFGFTVQFLSTSPFFPISMEKESGGGLEIGGTGHVFGWQVGD